MIRFHASHEREIILSEKKRHSLNFSRLNKNQFQALPPPPHCLYFKGCVNWFFCRDGYAPLCFRWAYPQIGAYLWYSRIYARIFGLGAPARPSLVRIMSIYWKPMPMAPMESSTNIMWPCFFTGNQIMFSVGESQSYRPGYDPFLWGCLNLLSWWKTKFQMFLKYFLSEGNPISGSGSSVWLLEDAHCGTKFQSNFAQLHQNIRYGGKFHCHMQSVQDKWQKFSKVDMNTISPAEYVSVSLLRSLPW